MAAMLTSGHVLALCPQAVEGRTFIAIMWRTDFQLCIARRKHLNDTKTFLAATAQGYKWAALNPTDAAQILLKQVHQDYKDAPLPTPLDADMLQQSQHLLSKARPHYISSGLCSHHALATAAFPVCMGANAFSVDLHLGGLRHLHDLQDVLAPVTWCTQPDKGGSSQDGFLGSWTRFRAAPAPA